MGVDAISLQLMAGLDQIDRKILRELASEGQISNIELADRVGLSPSACLRRVQELRRSGIIKGYRAVVDPAKLGLTFLAYVTVGLSSHTKKSQSDFEAAMALAPKLRECHNTGTIEYLLRVETQDLAAYKHFHTEVLGVLPQVHSITTYVLMDSPKDVGLIEGNALNRIVRHRISFHAETVLPRSRPRHRHGHDRPVARQCRRSCPPCSKRSAMRATGWRSITGWRGSRARRRRCARAYRAGDVDHPDRGRRDHAAQSCADGDRRTVRDAGGAVSRPHRPGPWPARGIGRPRRADAAPQSCGDERQFPQDVVELLQAFLAGDDRLGIRAVPRGRRCRCGSRGRACSARSSRRCSGLPYAFASHFAPGPALDEALDIYRRQFRPSEQLAEPYAAAAFNVFAADTRGGQVLLASSRQQAFVALRTGNPGR